MRRKREVSRWRVWGGVGRKREVSRWRVWGGKEEGSEQVEGIGWYKVSEELNTRRKNRDGGKGGGDYSFTCCSDKPLIPPFSFAF